MLIPDNKVNFITNKFDIPILFMALNIISQMDEKCSVDDTKAL